MKLASLFSNRQQQRAGRSRMSHLRFECLETRNLLSTFTVLNLADSGAGSLRSAIAAAETNPGADVIEFAKGVKGTITLTSGELLITQDLTLEGPGAKKLTVSGNQTSRIFNVGGGTDASTAITVSISGLTLADGRADGGGGITHANFSELTLADLVLSNNEAIGRPGIQPFTPNGGAIRSFGAGARLTLVNCLVTGNRVVPDPNGQFGSFGGAISTLRDSRLTIVGSTISDNQAISAPGRTADGGGIFASVRAIVVLDQTTIASNQSSAGAGSSASGGGITAALQASLTVNNSTVKGNQSIGDGSLGGGIFLRSSELTVMNCTVRDNQSLSRGDVTALGGGISLVDSTATIRDSRVRNNEAASGFIGDGGGISNHRGIVTITNSTISGNRAVGLAGGSAGIANGGGILNVGQGANLFIRDSTLTENQAIGGDGTEVGQAQGGALFNYLQAYASISNSTISGNRAIAGSRGVQRFDFADVGNAYGGAIYNYFGSEAVVRDSAIIHNRALGGNDNTGTGAAGYIGSGLGGGIANQNDAEPFGLGPTRLTVINSTIAHNEAVGGNENAGTGDELLVGAGLGGGIFNDLGAAADISGSSIHHNRAVGGDGNSAVGAFAVANLGAGGAIVNVFGNFELYGETLAPSIVNVTNSALEHNKAQGGEGDEGRNGGDAWGGAIANLFDATSNIAGSTLAHNRAIGGPGECGDGGNGYGGGAYNDATSSLALVTTTVTKNRADAGDGDDGSGDGEGIGGGLYNLGDLDLDALSSIFKNHASTDFDDLLDAFE
jgi:hypothetical protein